jgi:predicted O-methyltransferase YrrM
MPTNFTQNWFEATAKDNFDKYVKSLSGEFLEIGCFEGMATKWMLDNTTANITVIDTFKGSPEHKEMEVDVKGLRSRFENNIEHSERVKIYQGKSFDILRTKLSKKQYDFIYVDGSHATKDVLSDAVLCYPLLKKGGIIIFDDYTWMNGWKYEPRFAVDSFLHCNVGECEVLMKNSQCVVKK